MALLALFVAVGALAVSLKVLREYRPRPGQPTPAERIAALEERIRDLLYRVWTLEQQSQPRAPTPDVSPTPSEIPSPSIPTGPEPVVSVPPSASEPAVAPAEAAAATSIRDAVAHAPAPPEPAPPPRLDLEQRIGARWATWVGVVAILFAASFAVKWSIENNLIGPRARLGLGLAAGLASLLAGLVLHRRRDVPFLSEGLSGLGLGLCYLSLYAGYAYYELLRVGAAFGLMFVVTVLGTMVAVVSERQVTAVLALLGGHRALAGPDLHAPARGGDPGGASGPSDRALRPLPGDAAGPRVEPGATPPRGGSRHRRGHGRGLFLGGLRDPRSLASPPGGAGRHGPCHRVHGRGRPLPSPRAGRRSDRGRAHRSGVRLRDARHPACSQGAVDHPGLGRGGRRPAVARPARGHARHRLGRHGRPLPGRFARAGRRYVGLSELAAGVERDLSRPPADCRCHPRGGTACPVATSRPALHHEAGDAAEPAVDPRLPDALGAAVAGAARTLARWTPGRPGAGAGRAVAIHRLAHLRGRGAAGRRDAAGARAGR